MTTGNTFRPDYAPAPGLLLDETLQSQGLSARELARRCGRSPKLITEIVSGKAALEPETALQFEKVLSIDASIWMGLEAEYRLLLARQSEKEALTESIAWVRTFPLSELVKRNRVATSKASAEAVRELLAFFGVGSVTACEAYCESIGVSYRHSPSFSTNKAALFSWLRLGELEAERIICQDFDRSTLLEALDEIRSLSRTPDASVFLPRVVELLAKAGVALVIAKPFSGMALSGVSRWLTPRKALIQLTLRHMSNDHFWFTLFHEVAHLILHSRKTAFVDGRDTATGTSEEENEANDWAAHILVPRSAFDKFVAQGKFTAGSVRRFAEELGIAPGIVVGQLQKTKKIAFSYLNQLKVRYEWTD